MKTNNKISKINNNFNKIIRLIKSNMIIKKKDISQFSNSDIKKMIIDVEQKMENNQKENSLIPPDFEDYDIEEMIIEANRKMEENNKRNEIKKKIYEVIGEDGRNNTINEIIDEIINSIQKMNHLIITGSITTEKVKNLGEEFLFLMMGKFAHSEIAKNDLEQTFKSFVENLLNNMNYNYKNNIISIVELLKPTGNE